ncbi:MAG: hypothetical protein PQJ50_09730, partial [Spirochaetales bacterium]|nr:hypothetical protein [Spirochaetales bacterium]
HGDQQALWQATLSNELSLVITHPAVLPHEKGPTGNSPTYWVGDGRLPHAVQDRNIAISLYRLPRRAGIMEKRMLPFTHAWFPEALFDEAVVEGNHAFGRLDETYVAMTANSALEYIDPPELTVDGAKRDPPGRRELIQRGRETYWITEFSTAEEEDSFEAFRERIRSNETAYSGKTLTYSSRGRTLELTWKGDFKVNGEVQNTEYMRFDSPYIRAERKAETLDFEFGGQKLHLDFHRGIREF